MRTDIEIRKHLSEAIETSRGIMFVLAPSYKLVTSALKWSIGEGKKDNAIPGFGVQRGEYEIRTRIRECKIKRDRSISILAVNWQVIISSLEWVLGETEITPLDARESLFAGVFG